MRGSALCPPGPAPRHLRPLFSERVCLRLHYLLPGCLQPAASLSPKSLLLPMAPQGPFHKPDHSSANSSPCFPPTPTAAISPCSLAQASLQLPEYTKLAPATGLRPRCAVCPWTLPRSCSVSCVQGWVSAHSQAEWAARYLEAPSIQIRLTLQGSISRLPMGTTPALRVNSQRS